MNMSIRELREIGRTLGDFFGEAMVRLDEVVPLDATPADQSSGQHYTAEWLKWQVLNDEDVRAVIKRLAAREAHKTPSEQLRSPIETLKYAWFLFNSTYSGKDKNLVQFNILKPRLFLDSVGKHLAAVGDTISNDAKAKMYHEPYFQKVASDYFDGLCSIIDKTVLEGSRVECDKIVRAAFSDVKITGRDRVNELLPYGGIGVTLHFSYADVAAWLARAFAGLDNVHYIGGDNTPDSEERKEQLRKSGTILVNRNLVGEGKKGIIYNADLVALVSILQDLQKLVVVGAGAGRHKDGLVGNVNSAIIDSVPRARKPIFPLGVTYFIIPEDMEFAGAAHKTKRPSVAYVNEIGKATESFGPVYVHFGEPLMPEQYMPIYAAGGKKALEAELTRRVRQCVTLTPTNAVGALVHNYGIRHFTASQLTSTVGELVGKSTSKGLNVAPELTDATNLEELIFNAATALAKREGFSRSKYDEFSVDNHNLIKHYSNTITPTLAEAGITNVSRPA